MQHVCETKQIILFNKPTIFFGNSLIIGKKTFLNSTASDIIIWLLNC